MKELYNNQTKNKFIKGINYQEFKHLLTYLAIKESFLLEKNNLEL